MPDNIRIGSTTAIPDHLKTNPDPSNSRKKPRKSAAPPSKDPKTPYDFDEQLPDDDPTDHHQLDILI